MDQYEDIDIFEIDEALPPSKDVVDMDSGFEKLGEFMTTPGTNYPKFLSPMYRAIAQGTDKVYDFSERLKELGPLTRQMLPGGNIMYMIGQYGIGENIPKTFAKAELGEPITPLDGLEASLLALDLGGVYAGGKVLAKGAYNNIIKMLSKKGVSEEAAASLATKAVVSDPKLIDEYAGAKDIEELSDEAKDKLGVGAIISPDTKNNKFFGSYYLDQDIDYTSPPKDPMGEKIKPASIAVNDAMASNPGGLSTAKELLEELGTDPDTVSINAAQKGDRRAADIAGAGKIKTIKNIRHDGNASLYKKATQRKTDSEMERLASNPVIKKIFEKEKLIKSHALEQSAVKVLPGKFNTPRDFSIYEMIPQDLMATVKLGRLEDMDPTKPQVFSTQDRNMKHKAIGAAIVSNLIDKYKVLGYEFKPNKKNLGGAWTFNEELILPLPEKKKTLESINKNISTLEKQLKELKLETMFYDPTKDRLVFFGKGPESLTDLKKDVKKRGFAYGGEVTEDLDIFETPEDSLPEGSYETANLMLPLFKAFGKAPVNEVAPIPTPKEKLSNPTKKQTQSLETEKAKRAEEDIFDPTPNEQVELDPTMPVEVTPITQQPMTSVFYSDIERAMTNAPEEFANKQEVLDFLNKNRIKKSEVDDYRIAALLKLYDDASPIPKTEILSQVRSAPISGMRVHATGSGSEIINPNGEKRTRYTGYFEPGSIPDTQRERVLYINRDKLPGDTGNYPQSMFGGETIQRHEFGIPNEEDTYIVGWTRLSDRYGFVPPKVEGPQTKINVSKLTKEKTKNDRSLQGLYAEARSKIERLANQRGMSQADINDIMIDFGSDTPKLSVIAKYADQLDEISPGLVNQMDELVVKNNALQEQITKASGVDPSGVVRVTFADEIQSDLLQAAAGRKQQLAAALKKIQEEGAANTNLEGLNRVAQATIDFYEKNKSVFRPLTKTEGEVNVIAERINKLETEVDDIVNNYIATREIDQPEIDRLAGLLNDNINNMLDEVLSVDSNTMAGLFPDLPFKNRDEWADALIKKDLYELAYRKFVLKDPDASSYYAVSPSKYVSNRYNFKGDASTPAAERAADKQRRFDIFKRNGEFRDSQYKGIGMDEFYGGPNAVDESGKHYTSTLEKILKKQAQSNNSEIITMPVQLKSGKGATQYRVTDQNGNMVATLTNEDQARELLVSNPNYRIQPISIPNKKDMEPVFAIKITPEMLEPYKTHKAQGGLVEHIDIFEV
jgi:hypothetical protein